MNTRRLSIFTLLLFLIFSTTAAFAQFEGQISMKVYSEDNGEPEVNELNLYATSNRIMIRGEENFEIMDNMKTDGLLIRNDMKDFVVMTGNNQALQITKIEIEGFVEMMASWDSNSSKKPPKAPKTSYKFSDSTQTLLGLEAAELIIRDNENPEKHLSVWLTPDIDINWGMLAERWNNMPESMDAEINGMSQELIFKGKNFPLMIEAVDNDTRTKIMEVSNVNRSSVAKAMVEVPSGTTLMSFKDYVFKMMMEQ